MKITEISFKHYRGTESLKLKLDQNLNVFVGVNGSGKSTVLDGIAIMLSWAVSRIKSVGASGRPIPETDIKNGRSSALIEVSCNEGDRTIDWKLSKSRKGHASPDDRSNLNNLSEFTKQIQAEISARNENINLPIFVHYPVTRAVVNIPVRIRNKRAYSLLSIYDNSLTYGANFRTFFEWFREREDLENEKRDNPNISLGFDKQIIGQLESFITDGNDTKIKAIENKGQTVWASESQYIDAFWFSSWKTKCEIVLEKSVGKNSTAYLEFLRITNVEHDDISFNTIAKGAGILSGVVDILKSNINTDYVTQRKYADFDKQLEAVRDALQRFLPEFTNFRIRRSPLRMEVQKNGQFLTVNQLSDGEKCLIAMIGDLARRMAIANPTRDNPLEGSGIILIDEIDLHLHPKWQRNVVPKLVEVFPNCQFILSTHSPHVINHVQPENLFFLDKSSDGIVATRPSKSYGNNADRILEDLMGLETTRPDDIFQELREIYELISQNLLPDATNRIALLKKKIGADPELVKAEVLIKRKGLIGK
jgi:predicted ATP-binding protein involved in virulence